MCTEKRNKAGWLFPTSARKCHVEKKNRVDSNLFEHIIFRPDDILIRLDEILIRPNDIPVSPGDIKLHMNDIY